MGKKYVAYVGTYTHGTSKGIHPIPQYPRMESICIPSRMKALRFSNVTIMVICHVSTVLILMVCVDVFWQQM